MLAKLFVRVVSVPFLLYVAATLGPSLFGVFSFVLATVEMVSSLGDFGLSRYGTRFLVREEKDQARFVGILLSLQVFTSVVLAGGGLIVVLIARPDSPKMQVLLLGLGAVLLSAFVYTTETIFTAAKNFAASALFAILGRLVYLVAGFTVLGLGYSVVAVMWAYLASMAIESLVRMSYVITKVTRFSFKFTWDDTKKVGRGTLPFAATALATLVYYRADTIIMEIIRGDADVGIYSAAYSFFSFFVWVPIVLSRALLPVLTARYRDNPAEAEYASWYWYRLAGVTGVAVAFIMTMLAGPIIDTLMPNVYSESVVTLRILMWAIPTLMLVSMSFNSLTVRDKEKKGAHTSAFAAVMIVAMDLALIPRYGPRGAAVAMVVTTALWSALTYILLSKYVFAAQHRLYRTFSMPVIGGILMTGAALVVSSAGIAFSLVAGLAVYGATVLVLRALEHKHRDQHGRVA